MIFFTRSLYVCAFMASTLAFADDTKSSVFPFHVSTQDQTEFVKSLANDSKASVELTAGYLALSYQTTSGIKLLVGRAEVLSNYHDPCVTTYRALFRDGTQDSQMIWGTYVYVSGEPRCVGSRRPKIGAYLSVVSWDLNQMGAPVAQAKTIFKEKLDPKKDFWQSVHDSLFGANATSSSRHDICS